MYKVFFCFVCFLSYNHNLFGQIDNTLIGKQNDKKNESLPISQDMIISNKEEKIINKLELQNKDSTHELDHYIANNQNNFNNHAKHISINKSGLRNEKNNIIIDVQNAQNTLGGKVKKYENKGYFALIDGDYENAIYFYKKGLSYEPKNGALNFGLAVCYQNLLQYQDAFLYYKLALKNQFNIRKIINNVIIMSHIAKISNGISMLLELNNKTSNNIHILGELGILYIKNNDFDSAIRYLNNSIELSKDNNLNKVIYSYYLALAHEKINNHGIALSYYEFVLNNNMQVNLPNFNIDNLHKSINNLKKIIAKNKK